MGLVLSAALALGVPNSEARCPRWDEKRMELKADDEQQQKQYLETKLSEAKQYAKENVLTWVKQELFPILRIPSLMYEISEDGSMEGLSPEQKEAVDKAKGASRKTAQYLTEALEKRGVQTKLIENPNLNPAVYGELKSSNPNALTVLIYGHYDVQKVSDPVKEFTPSLEKVVINENGNSVEDLRITARGASDDKGQIYTHLFAIDAYRKVFGELPINFKFLIEGGEESGSPGMEELVKDNKELLKSDLIIVTDGKNDNPNVPVINTSLRGLVTAKIYLNTAKSKLHSGAYGGPATSCFYEMIQLTSRLRDPSSGKILIPGIYEDVLPISPEEKKLLSKSNQDLEKECQQSGVVTNFGEKGYSAIEQVLLRPTLEITNISNGVEANTLVGECDAYVTMRLVADQDPHKVFTQLESRIYSIADEIGLPKEAITKVEFMNHAHPVKVNREGEIYQAAVEAIKISFNSDSISYLGSGGSEAIVAYFNEHIKAPTLMNGFGRLEDNAHADNESFLLERGLLLGIETNLRIYQNLAGVKKK